MESSESLVTLFREFFGKHRCFREYFVKVMRKGMLRHSMHLPSKKDSIFKRYLSKEVTLQVPGGKEWRVRVQQNSNNKYLYFRPGWMSFVLGNNLQLGDQVHFFYVGYGRFCVVICPDDGSFARRKFRRGKRVALQRRRGRNPGTSGERTRAKRTKRDGRAAKKTGSKNTELCEMREVKSFERSPLFLRRNFRRQLPQVRSPAAEQEHALKSKSAELELALKTTTEAGHSPRSDMEFVTLCRTALKSFIFPLKRTDYDVVDVERTLAEKFLSKTPTRMFLVDTSGKRWPVKWFGWERCALACGWVDFVVHHKLESGDLCSFQLEDPKAFKVRVYKLSPAEMEPS